jgi:hypothetical protein
MHCRAKSSIRKNRQLGPFGNPLDEPLQHPDFETCLVVLQGALLGGFADQRQRPTCSGDQIYAQRRVVVVEVGKVHGDSQFWQPADHVPYPLTLELGHLQTVIALWLRRVMPLSTAHPAGNSGFEIDRCGIPQMYG